MQIQWINSEENILSSVSMKTNNACQQFLPICVNLLSPLPVINGIDWCT